MADKVTVFDATGVQREVHAVDAREIVAAGGSYTANAVPPLKEKPKAVHPAEAKPKKAAEAPAEAADE